MLKVLLQKQMSEIFRTYFYDAKKNCARSKGQTVAFMLLYGLLMVGILGGSFTALSVVLCAPLCRAGMGWLYFALIGLLSCFLGVFGSVFSTYSGLYLSRDNDLLLAMPIPVRCILASRLLSVYLMGLMFSGVVLLPAAAVYWAVNPFRLSALAGGLLLVLLVSVLVLVLSCLLGWVVARISLRLKNKSLITVLLSLLFFFGYYFCFFKAQQLIGQLLEHAAEWGEKIRGAAWLLYLFGRVGEGDFFAATVWTVLTAALFALTIFVLARSFLKIATATGRGGAARKKAVKFSCRSADAALFYKELGRYGASANYILNCGLGTPLLALAGIGLFIWGRTLTVLSEQLLGAWDGATAVLLCAGACMLCAMNNMAAPSVSLEGKTLWQLQALPVRPWQVLRAKLLLQLLLTGAPLLLCLAGVFYVLPGKPLLWALIALTTMSYTAFSGLFCLLLGLKFPNLTWQNELTPIKQSFSVMIALFGGWGYVALLVGGFFLCGGTLGAGLYLLAASAVTMALCIPAAVWLKRRGCQIFAQL